jgi:glycine/D-amino acid oxidase-like deaminating enzyme
LVSTTADVRRSGPRRSLPLNHLPCENRRTQGRIGEVGLRQTPEGRLLAAIHFEDARADAVERKVAADAFETIRGMIVSDGPLLPESHVIGRRPIPKDGFPAIGRSADISGLYVAVMHSGITLAPVIGRLVADEVLTDRRDSLIDAYGLERFL